MGASSLPACRLRRATQRDALVRVAGFRRFVEVAVIIRGRSRPSMGYEVHDPIGIMTDRRARLFRAALLTALAPRGRGCHGRRCDRRPLLAAALSESRRPKCDLAAAESA